MAGGVSIGIKSGPLIGVQKGPPLDRRREASRERARLHGARSERAACGGQARLLKRQLSLPVSTMSQW